MPTVFTHGVAAAALITAFPQQAVPRRLALLGVACSMAPDIDVVGVNFGLHAGDLLDHRGVTHSIIFAVAIASLAFLAARSRITAPAKGKLIWLYLFLATASHGLLDALTDRTGLGVPFFWPFDSHRYFFPHTPIEMSPIGTHFFTHHGFVVLASELRWIWLPSLLFVVIAVSCRHILAARSLSREDSI